MLKEIHWGIIGTGGIARVFAKEMTFVEGSSITAICARSSEKGDEFIALFGKVDVYIDYATMLREADIDAIYVATPHTLHKENTIQALNAGKAVMCEKPMGANVSDVEQMIEASRHNKVLLMEAIWTRFCQQ